MSDFTKEMEALAAQLAKDANMAEKNFGDRLDAFKALMPYYTLLKKNAGKPVDDDGLPNFTNFANAIHATDTEDDDGDDEPGLRGGRRNGN
jgi:hypothetical protein